MAQDKRHVAVVTGGSRGLGLEIVRELLRRGWYVATCSQSLWSLDVRRRLGDVQQERLIVQPVDVTDLFSVIGFIGEVQAKTGGIDVLVNNAATIVSPEYLWNMSDRQVEQMLRVNVMGPFICTWVTVPVMKQDGTIINIASKAGIWPTPRVTMYSASKAALIAMTAGLAKELEQTGKKIRSIAVSPGGMNTRMRAYVAGEEDAKKQMDPALVARIVADIATRERDVPNGTNVIIIKGNVTLRRLIGEGGTEWA